MLFFRKLFVFYLLLGTWLISFSQDVSNSSFGKGLRLVTADSSLSVKFHFRMQHLYTASFDQESEKFESNALVRRSRLKFSGKAYSDKLSYKVELGLTSRDIGTNKEFGQGRDASRIILDALLKYRFQKHWTLWIGQTKLPGNRERVVSSANLQFVDRSLVNSRFNIDRDMGIQLRGKLKAGQMVFEPKFSISNGEGRNITEGNHGGLCYTARLDWLPFGQFEGKKQDYILSDINRQSKPKLAIGITANENQNTVRQQGQLGSFVIDSMGNFVESTLSHIEADAHFKFKGFSALVEWAKTTGSNKQSDVSSKFMTGEGINAQVGYLLHSNWELSARYTEVEPDSDVSGIKQQKEYTLGFSKYIVGHSLKVQSDFAAVQNDISTDQNTYRCRIQVEMQF
jgi:hypothetical protein